MLFYLLKKCYSGVITLRDIIIKDHSPKNLEKLYENVFVYQNNDYSIMCETTEVPWLQFIPRHSLSKPHQVSQLYSDIYKMGDFLVEKGLGEIFNVAKIGNKLPYYHIHLILRSPTDEAWPEAIWCSENLRHNEQSCKKLTQLIQAYFSACDD